MDKHTWTSPAGEVAEFETAAELTNFLKLNGLSEEKPEKKRVKEPEETKAEVSG